ncbi:hypothetical protein RMCBS344292_06702 [Rhizopus microsporus]|nr:hypothetical protein RMCBS344292_06702 [Rhizopus microsporus]
MNVGRMGPEAREARRRELEAEEASIHVAMDMISEVERTSLYNVQSFNNADETYEVHVENDMASNEDIFGSEKIKAMIAVGNKLGTGDIGNNRRAVMGDRRRHEITSARSIKSAIQNIWPVTR